MGFYKLPRGIQETTRANKDGSPVTAYRVQMNRKDKATGEALKVDKLFASIPEALDFLNSERKKLGLKKLEVKQDEQKKKDYEIKQKELKNQALLSIKENDPRVKSLMLTPDFSFYVKKYIEDFLNIKYRNLLNKKLSEMTAEEKHKYKNYTNKISKLERIVSFKVQANNLGPLEVYMKQYSNDVFGNIPLVEITPSIINSYVKTRIQDNLRASSIRAEIVLISSVIDYSIQTGFLMNEHQNYRNPTKDFNKKLYSLAIPAKSKFFRFSDEGKQEFIKAVETNKNPEMAFIIKLIMMTAMRRAEVILLKWSQVHDNFIELTDTKTNPRPVYLTTEAKALLNSIPKKENQDRVFSYTVTGFEASLRYHLNKFGLRDITTHKLRKNSISEFVEVIGSDNSLLISEVLGIRDIVGLEREIKTMPASSLSSQTEVLKSVGHTTSAVTKRHYFSLNLKRNKK